MAKPIFEKVPLIQSSFLYKEEIFNQYNIPFHLHPEYEIALITNTKNTQFLIGDHQNIFTGTTLFLLGQNTPHSWVNVNKDNSNSKNKSLQIIVQFKKEFLGYHFFQQPEFAHINELLRRSGRGIEFHGNTLRKVSVILKKMNNSDAFQRTIRLLKVLDIMSRSEEFQFLSSLGYAGLSNEADSSRMNTIFKYVINNYKNNINLEEIAKQINMTETSFCKYFKERTRKTFITYLNEIRIGYACKLIINGNKTISQICYESGFKNLSNFNRQFKKITKETPSSFKRKSIHH